MSRFLILALALCLTGGAWPAPGPGHATYGGGGGGGSVTLVQTSTACNDNNASTPEACASAFGSNVTSGNLILCAMASEDQGSDLNPAMTIAGTATLSAWSERATGITANIGDCEIDTATVTGTGTLTPTMTYAAGNANHMSGVCYELSGGQVGTAVTDSDADAPQQEAVTLTFSNSYLFGVLSDYSATGAITLTSSPALTSVFSFHDATRYSTIQYRTTNPISSNPTVGAASPNGTGHVGHCIIEVGPS